MGLSKRLALQLVILENHPHQPMCCYLLSTAPLTSQSVWLQLAACTRLLRSLWLFAHAAYCLRRYSRFAERDAAAAEYARRQELLAKKEVSPLQVSCPH